MGTIIAVKLKAATLVETIVALVIILALFGIAATVIVQTTAKGTAMQELKAEAILDEYVLNTHDQKELFDEETASQEFMIRRKVAEYQDRPGLIRINYQIYNKQQVLLENRDELYPAQ